MDEKNTASRLDGEEWRCLMWGLWEIPTKASKNFSDILLQGECWSRSWLFKGRFCLHYTQVLLCTSCWFNMVCERLVSLLSTWVSLRFTGFHWISLKTHTAKQWDFCMARPKSIVRVFGDKNSQWLHSMALQSRLFIHRNNLIWGYIYLCDTFGPL